MNDYKIVSHCPHCGAPIYELRQEGNTTAPVPPQIVFNCECRHKIYFHPYYCYPHVWKTSEADINISSWIGYPDRIVTFPYEHTSGFGFYSNSDIDYTITGSTNMEEGNAGGDINLTELQFLPDYYSKKHKDKIVQEE